MKVSELLACAIEKLPGHWCKKHYAKTGPRGKGVGVAGDNATCFCMVGCLRRCEYDALPFGIKEEMMWYSGVTLPLTRKAENFIKGVAPLVFSSREKAVTGTTVEALNDFRWQTEEGVLRLLTRARINALDYEAAIERDAAQQEIVHAFQGGE